MFNNQSINKFIKICKKKFKQKKISLHAPIIERQDFISIKNCLNSNYVSTFGPYVNKFEKEIANFTKAKFVVAVNSGTSALHLSLISLNVKRNDEVLMPSLNFVASANTVVYCGAIPHFIESESITLGIDPEKLESYLRKQTHIKNNVCINKKTRRRIKALIAVHIFGHACQIIEIKRICKRFKISLIEDAAEALGSKYKNKHLGTFGDVGILSFNGNKIITAGAGGAIMTSKIKIAKNARILSQVAKQPHPWNYNYNQVGFNYRMPNLNASLGLSQLKFVKNRIKKKRELFNFYKKTIKQFPEFELIKEPKNSQSNYWLQGILLDDKTKKYKNRILGILNNKNFESRPLWQLLTDMKHFKKFPRMKIVNSKKIFERVINIPSNI